MLHPCDNCGETDEHTCTIDGVEYGPYRDDAPISASSLRNIADWFDTYDKLAEQYFDLIVAQGLRTEDEVAGARAACSGDEIQRDLRRWANEMENV